MQRYTVVKHSFPNETEVEVWAAGMKVLERMTKNFKYWAIQLPNGKYEAYCFYPAESYKHSEYPPPAGTRVLSYNNIIPE